MMYQNKMPLHTCIYLVMGGGLVIGMSGFEFHCQRIKNGRISYETEVM